MTLAQLLRCSVAIAALAAPAYAAQEGIYLLQLGSFEKKDAAQERWAALQNKYPNLLESLSVRYMDVTLPPDNFTVFRTQAGALTSRANAQSICDRLTAKGDECYVVETAMFTPGDMSASVPNAPMQSELNPQAAAPNPAPTKVAAAAPELAPKKEMKVAAAAEAPAAPPSPPVKPLAETAAAAAPVPPAPAMEQAAPQERKQAARTAPKQEEDGFWSFVSALDPFAEDAPEKSSAPKSKPAPKQEMAMATPPAPPSAPPAAPPADVVELEPMQHAPGQSMPWQQVADPFSPPAPGQPAPGMMPPSPPPAGVQPPAPDQPAPMAAVQPPAPLMGSPAAPVDGSQYQVPTFEMTDKAASASQGFTLPPPPAPAAGGAVMAPDFARYAATPLDPGVKHPATVAPMGSAADVKVSEAVRVPLTESAAPVAPAEPSLDAERARLATPPMAMGTPSQEAPGMKTLWAQIGYFPDQQHALAYWETFRQANPAFPAVRVRITSPYMATKHGAPKVSLRVGPFDQSAYVNDLCDDIVQASKRAEQSIDCKSVADINESVPQRLARATGGEQLRDAYYSKQQVQTTEMYWVQIGSFNTPTEATNFWGQLAAAQKPTLDGIAPNIAPPIMSSSMQPIFRLRAGPYPLRTPADELCAKLQARGSQCLIVFSK